MATNYTLAQAIKIMHGGKDTEAIIEITRRFPQLALLANTILTKAGEDFVKLTSAFPEWMTANKMNGLLKKAYEGTTSDEGDEETTEEATEAEAKDEAEEKPARRRGKKKEEAKEPEETTEEEAESDDPYAGKSAMDLFKECKKRKIKVEPKKPAKFYADLLKKDDAAKAQETDDDDWGDDDAAKEKKPDKKADKKAAKKEDDDEDWDI